MDIEKFSRQTIEEYKSNSRSMGAEEAKRISVYAAAANAADREGASIGGAAKAARHAIEAYEAKAKAGLSDEKAMESAARDTAGRFDDRAHDTAKTLSQDRPKSRGIGL